MTGIWRVILFLYSLLLAVVGAVVLFAAMGGREPFEWFNMLTSSPERFIAAGIAAVLLVIAIVTLIYSLSFRNTTTKTVLVSDGIAGQISMTIPAAKVIIMKAVKKVEGIKDIRTTINNKPEGLDVLLHTMINPEYNVPEMSERIQTAVRQHLEEIGGLKVASIRVLVDDFGSATKAPGN